MSLGFNDFAEDLKENSKGIAERYKKFDELDRSINNVAEKIDKR
jgi:hypothetical protein